MTYKPNAYERREALRKAKAREAYQLRQERRRIAQEGLREAQETRDRDAREHEAAMMDGHPDP